MNAFAVCQDIEREGRDALLPFITEQSSGRYVLTNKGRLAPMLQECAGDLLMHYATEDPETLYGVELKVEAENRHGNFFLETWSNKKFRPRRIGWMFNNASDQLWYYFIKSDDLYVISMPQLWWWAHCYPRRAGDVEGPGRLHDFPERAQSKYDQLNKAFGRCVPISVIAKEVGFKRYFPKTKGTECIEHVGPDVELAANKTAPPRREAECVE